MFESCSRNQTLSLDSSVGQSSVLIRRRSAVRFRLQGPNKWQRASLVLRCACCGLMGRKLIWHEPSTHNREVDRFEPFPAYHQLELQLQLSKINTFPRVAQSAERRLDKAKVSGSNPLLGTKFQRRRARVVYRSSLLSCRCASAAWVRIPSPPPLTSSQQYQ